MLTEMLPDPSPLLFLMEDSRPQPTLLTMRMDLLLRLPTLVLLSILLNQLLGMAMLLPMLLLLTNQLLMLGKEDIKTVYLSIFILSFLFAIKNHSSLTSNFILQTEKL